MHRNQNVIRHCKVFWPPNKVLLFCQVHKYTFQTAMRIHAYMSSLLPLTTNYMGNNRLLSLTNVDYCKREGLLSSFKSTWSFLSYPVFVWFPLDQWSPNWGCVPPFACLYPGPCSNITLTEMRYYSSHWHQWWDIIPCTDTHILAEFLPLKPIMGHYNIVTQFNQ